MADREARSFVEYVEGRILPRWMSGELGKGFVGVVVTLIADAMGEMLAEATRAPWLAEDSSPDDALPRVGRELRIPKYPVESVSQYRQRLLDAPLVYQAGGDEETITGQVEKAGFQDADIYDPWQWEREPFDYWSQFWIFLPEGTHTVTAPGPVCGSGVIAGTGAICGPVGIAPEVLQSLRALARKWKSVRWIARQIIFEIEGPTCGTGVLAGSGALCGGSSAVVGVV